MSAENGDVAYWQARWDKRAIGFHLLKMNPSLAENLDVLLGEDGKQIVASKGNLRPKAKGAKRVFFPLCGKSVDMAIIASSGHYASGIDGVITAIQEFAEESQNIITEVTSVSSNIAEHFDVYRGPNLEFFVGDFFQWPTYAKYSKEQLQQMGACDLYDCAFDRGSMVAITPNLREKYVQVMDTVIAPGGKILIAALEYDQAEMDGPPYSLSEDSVRAIYNTLPDGPDRYTVETLGNPQWITENSSGDQFNRFLKSEGGHLSKQRTVALLVTKKY